MKRTPLVRKTPLKRSPVKRARQSQKRKRPTGFTEETKAQVRKRSANQCEVNSEGCSHKAAHFHHRQLRRHGDHSETNCLHVCSWCHLRIHENPEISYVMGWMVQSYRDPAEVPVLRGAG
jgi:hypothetical protein